jgi:hypothetical protein
MGLRDVRSAQRSDRLPAVEPDRRARTAEAAASPVEAAAPTTSLGPRAHARVRPLARGAIVNGVVLATAYTEVMRRKLVLDLVAVLDLR